MAQSPGEIGMGHYRALFGGFALPMPWDCHVCNVVQMNREPYIVDSKPTCARCFWAHHVEQSE